MQSRLQGRYETDFASFDNLTELRRGMPAFRNAESTTSTLVGRAQALAERWFRSAGAARSSDGSVIVDLGSDHLLALSCRATYKPDAFSDRTGLTYFAVLGDALLRSLFGLAAAVWSCPDVATWLTPAPASIPKYGDAVPPGLEEVDWSADLQARLRAASDESSEELRKAGLLAAAAIAPAALPPRLASLVGARKVAFEASFDTAVRFVWLHEVAHVLLGHVDLVKEHRSLGFGELDDDLLALASDGGPATAPAVSRDLPYRVLEMEADLWAMKRLLLPLAEADFARLAPVVVGLTLPLMVFHGFNVLAGRSDAARKHPPLWYRGDRIVRELLLPREHRDGVISLLSQVGSIHPLYGEWLGPATADLRTEPMANFHRQALAERQPWEARLRASRLPPLPVRSASDPKRRCPR